MTAQSGFQRGKQIHALLAQRRQVASDTTKGCRSRFAAEGAGDLLLHFEHAHIPLRLVIVKRDDEAVQEGQHSLLVADQAVQQVAGRTLFGASSGAGGALAVGVVASACARSATNWACQSSTSNGCNVASFISSNKALRSLAHSRPSSSARN